MIFDTLKKTGLPVVYSHFKEPQSAPFLVYLGAGQNQFDADDTRYWHKNLYQVEYYFETKNETLEEEIETTLLADGYRFTKSADTYISSEGVFVIYYSVN